MADNGKKYVQDWYDPSWYAKSLRKDPHDPDNGIIRDEEIGQYFKVLRGAFILSPGRPSGLTFSRTYQIPEPGFSTGLTARCVVDDPHPLNAIRD